MSIRSLFGRKKSLSGEGGGIPSDNRESGFTIVEVMIVLAIAGLVLAIVFIAVPALQRNSRDAQRRADISALQAGIATYVGNNNGQIPDGNTLAQLNEAKGGVDFSFYTAASALATATPGDKTINTEARADLVSQNNLDTVPATETATYVANAQCNTATVTKTTAWTADAANLTNVGQSRNYVILYATESDPNWICIDNV